MSTRARHILALLGTLIVPAFAAWQTGSDLPAKIALAVGVVLAALMRPEEIGELKNILANVGVIAAPIMAAVLGHLTAGASVAYLATLVPAILLNLQKALGAASAGALPARPMGEVVDLPTAKLGKPGPGAPVVAVLMLAGSMLWGSAARAQTYGGCFAGGVLCAGPSASITVVNFNLATSSFTGGISPGVGYGVTFTPPSAPWAAVGLDLYASVRLGQSLPNMAMFSLMGHFANYVFLGIGPTVTQEPAGVPALVQWSILGGFGVPLDLSAYRARAAVSAGGK
jgi:hypothetical protein